MELAQPLDDDALGLGDDADPRYDENDDEGDQSQ